MRLAYCTLTGADDNTDIIQLADMASEFPFVEWAFLYSSVREGSARYPTQNWIARALDTLPKNVNVAVHMCGSAVDDCINGADHGGLDGRSTEVLRTRILIHFAERHGGRIQLNARRSTVQHADFTRLFDYAPNAKFILQHNSYTAPLIESLQDRKNLSVLCDKSGGRGVREENWQPSPFTGLPYGYAGGIGPGTIEQDLADIEQVAPSYDTWIDMESSLRTVLPSGKDIFDLQKCRDVLTVAAGYAADI